MEQRLGRMELTAAARSVAQTVCLPYRRLAVGEPAQSAGCQPATRQAASLRYKKLSRRYKKLGFRRFSPDNPSSRCN